MELKELIKRTEYKKDADKMAEFFRINRINTVDELSNSMARLGTKVVGHDIFQVVHALRQEEAKILAEDEAKASISTKGEKPDVIPVIAEEAPEPPSKGKSGSTKKEISHE